MHPFARAGILFSVKNHLSLTHVCFSFIIAIAWLGSSAIAAFPLADHVPGDAVAYVGWAGADSQAMAYRDSDLAAFIDHSNLPDVARQYLPKLWSQLAGPGEHPQEADALKKVLPLLWHHGVAIYASNITIGADGTPDASVALICDAGTDAAELAADLGPLVKGNSQMHITTSDSLVIAGVNVPPDLPPGSTLADNATFIATMKKLQSSPALAIYVDGATILAKAGESAEKDVNAAEIWPKVRDALGIASLKTFAMTAGFDGSNWMSASVLDAPTPRTGLLAVIEPQPIDPALLARIPATAGSVSVFNFDAAKLYDTLGDAMAVRTESDTVFHQATGLATIALGRNFRRQILGPLGPQWVMYSDSTLHSVVVMNHPKKPDDAGDAMVSATFGLVNLANAQLGKTQPVANAVQAKVKGLDVTSAVTSFASPSFVVNDGILYFGLSPDSVVASATVPTSPPGSDLLHSDGFVAAKKRLGVRKFAAFDYCDLPVTAPRAYDNFGAAGAQIRKLMDLAGVEIPRIELPPIDQIRAHLSPALSVNWADADGIYSKSVSPFPGSTHLLGDPQQTMVSATTISAITTLIAPLIEKSRQKAISVSSMSNERQLLLAMMMYAANHQGVFPADLGSLVSDGEIQGSVLSVFIDPASGQSVPADVAGGTKDQQAAWVNGNAGYVFLAPSQKISQIHQPSETIVIVPKDSDHATQPVPVGFADGHCEITKAARVQQLLHADAVQN